MSHILVWQSFASVHYMGSGEFFHLLHFISSIFHEAQDYLHISSSPILSSQEPCVVGQFERKGLARHSVIFIPKWGLEPVFLMCSKVVLSGKKGRKLLCLCSTLMHLIPEQCSKKYALLHWDGRKPVLVWGKKQRASGTLRHFVGFWCLTSSKEFQDILKVESNFLKNVVCFSECKLDWTQGEFTCNFFLFLFGNRTRTLDSQRAVSPGRQWPARVIDRAKWDRSQYCFLILPLGLFMNLLFESLVCFCGERWICQV